MRKILACRDQSDVSGVSGLDWTKDCVIVFAKLSGA